MKCKYKHWLPKMLKVNAITLNKTIYYAMPAREVTGRLRRHEGEHIKQYEREGFICFLWHYVKEYIKNRLDGLDHYDAYYNISYEVKARKSE